MRRPASLRRSRWARAALPIAAALVTAAPSALADEPRFDSSFDPSPAAPRAFASLMASPGMCAPGTRVACPCPNGTWSQQTCEPTGLRFSVCACASVSVNVPTLPPVPNVPNVSVWVPRPHPHRPSKPSSGLGMLIGGGMALLSGTSHLIWGIERLRETRNDPFGIVLIATGGTAMAAGLPLTIVGIALFASRGILRENTAWTLAPTASGPALQF